MITTLRGFQKRFLRGALDPEIDTAVLSLPRGNGKSALAGHLVTRILDPSDILFQPGTESTLFSGSIEQCRIVFRFARYALEPRGGYKFTDSATRVAINHPKTNTRLRVVGSNAKTSMGLVNCPYAISDEPGAWEVNGGTLLFDAIQTAQGKPGSPLKAIYIGTIAPAQTGWWPNMVAAGSHSTTFVQALQADPEKWDQWSEIRRVNPLTAVSAKFRKKLLEERDEARKDSRLKARFLSYRLNVPTEDEATVLLTVDDWKRSCARPVPERKGRPIVGVDLGAGRAWSAAVAMWTNGRTEALAVAPGIPSLEDQEKRDRVPSGTYRKLAESGALAVAEGLRVQPPAQLVKMIRQEWGTPEFIIADRMKKKDLLDAAKQLKVVFRVTNWSEAAFDIRALRKFALDGPLSVTESSRLLLTASLSLAKVKPDNHGNVRLTKKDEANNTARDDVAASLALVAGAIQRRMQGKSGGWSHAVAA